YPVPAEEQEFARVLIQAALENHKAIDALIKERLVNWELSRISAVSRAILRTGIAQLLYLKEEADDAVVIDEALLLTKQYDAIEAAAFINGLLDDIISYRDDKKERVLPKPKPLAQKIKIKSKLKRQI
ncbi:MAG TPA: transcription antitermination protein NusB, partial [Turneriella sp.]|nr:transcription antitermination protein NusB [Turneriella sp.]